MKKQEDPSKVHEEESHMPYDHKPIFRSDQKEETRKRVGTLLTFLIHQLLWAFASLSIVMKRQDQNFLRKKQTTNYTLKN